MPNMSCTSGTRRRSSNGFSPPKSYRYRLPSGTVTYHNPFFSSARAA